MATSPSDDDPLDGGFYVLNVSLWRNSSLGDGDSDKNGLTTIQNEGFVKRSPHIIGHLHIVSGYVTILV